VNTLEARPLQSGAGPWAGSLSLKGQSQRLWEAPDQISYSPRQTCGLVLHPHTSPSLSHIAAVLFLESSRARPRRMGSGPGETRLRFSSGVLAHDMLRPERVLKQ
jgi:hypothetical protein